MQDSVYSPKPALKYLPDSAPNILIVLIDDAGPGMPDVFGGEVHTPTLERVFKEGIGYNRFHTTAMCSPTPASLNVWRERHGGDRQYYHFIYKDVLFLMVNFEDPPKDTNRLREENPEQAVLIDNAYTAVKQAIAAHEPIEKILEHLTPIEEFCGTIHISDTQVAYFKQVLEANHDVRWVFVLIHSPA